MDIKEFLAIPWRMKPLTYSGIRFSIANRHCVFVFNLDPLGMATDMFFFLKIVWCLAAGIRKCVVAPESVIALLFSFFVGGN